jgi:hypothetical protein
MRADRAQPDFYLALFLALDCDDIGAKFLPRARLSAAARLYMSPL